MRKRRRLLRFARNNPQVATMSDEIQWVNAPLGEAKSFRCPCCKCKTLHGRGHFELCPVCWWEDDGQDDADAERVLGGPNGELSLRRAQTNFQTFGAAEEIFKDRVRPPEPDEL
jgi:hypothetical protein